MRQLIVNEKSTGSYLLNITTHNQTTVNESLEPRMIDSVRLIDKVTFKHVKQTVSYLSSVRLNIIIFICTFIIDLPLLFYWKNYSFANIKYIEIYIITA